jgi:mycoredoxin
VSKNYNPATAYRPEKSYSAMSISRSVRERTVTIYANSWCPHSKRSRALLSQLHIPFTNVDFDMDSSAARQVEIWNNGFRSSPTIIIHQILTEPSLVELERLFISSDARLLGLDVYMTSWCPDCRRTINWLKENGVAFRALDIDKDSVAAARVSAWNQGNLSVPTLDVTLCVTEPSSDQLLASLALSGQS